MSKIVIISHLPLSNIISGPAARYLNFALELNKLHEITVLMPKTIEVNDNLKNTQIIIEDLNLKNIIKLKRDIDCIIIHGLTLLKYPVLRLFKKPLIVDIYNTFLFENLEAKNTDSLWIQKLFFLADSFIIKDQLLTGDFFVCSNESQRNFWLGLLLSLGRVTPTLYKKDKNLSGFLEIVPFGLEGEKPKKTKNVLKGVRKGIEIEDKLLLWHGGLWDWFDPETLILAINEIIKERHDIKLVFLGVRTSNNESTNKAVQSLFLSKELNILNRYVFFEDWIPYNNRHNYLLEADLVISTYYSNLETKFAMRTRMLDSIWTETPMIVTKGDYFAEIIKSKKLGAVVSEQDIDELKKVILDLVDDQEQIKQIKSNIKDLRTQRSEDVV